MERIMSNAPARRIRKPEPIKTRHLVCIHFYNTGTLPEVTIEDPSSDRKYLFEMCRSVISGNCDDNFSKKKPGKLAHAIWLTTVSRLRRLSLSL